MKKQNLFKQCFKGKLIYPLVLVFISLTTMSWLSKGWAPVLNQVILLIILVPAPALISFMMLSRGALMFYLGALITQVMVTVLLFLYTAYSLFDSAGFGAVAVVIYVLITGFSDGGNRTGREAE